MKMSNYYEGDVIMKKKLFLVLALCLVMAFSVGCAKTNEEAEEASEFDLANLVNFSDGPQDISQEQLDKVKENLLKNDVDEETADKLILKLKDGELWDSMNPKYRDLEPQVKTEHYEKTTYPDGSICVVRSGPTK